MRINNISTSTTFNPPESSPTNNIGSDGHIDTFSANSTKPLTREEWKKRIIDEYNRAVSQGDQGTFYKYRTEWEALLQKTLALIDKEFDEKDYMFDFDSMHNFISELRALINRYPGKDRQDGVNTWERVARESIEKELKLAINFQATAVRRYQEEIKSKIAALIALLDTLGTDSPNKKALEDGIASLRNQLAELEKSKTPAEFFNKDNLQAIDSAIQSAQMLLDLIKKPVSEIPLEGGDSVRNQRGKTKGIGVGSGALYYLKAFYAFTRACNKLISMNTAWGMQVAELQREGTKLSISCQDAIAVLMKKEMDNFDEKRTGGRMQELQGRLGNIQSAFTAYDKQLGTVMPLIIDQPKAITKDLDKFLEAAKSILQLISAYANFRI